MSVEESTDANLFTFLKSKKTKDEADSNLVVQQPQIPLGVDRYSDVYKMDHYRRGSAIIFNHNTFDDFNMSERKGTEIDAASITAILKEMKFEVKVYDDLNYSQVMKVLKETAAADHSNADCLLIVVMSHGDTDQLHARDFTYNPKRLWEPFSSDLCASLAGKPKMFFIQACRGDKLDAGTKLRTQHDGDASSSYVIPSKADFLVMYSTAENHYSFRSPLHGSWFIQCLCKELKTNWRHLDLMTILTFVNRKMAIEYKSTVPSNAAFHNKKQIGSIVSSLMRLIYFYDSETK